MTAELAAEMGSLGLLAQQGCTVAGAFNRRGDRGFTAQIQKSLYY